MEESQPHRRRKVDHGTHKKRAKLEDDLVDYEPMRTSILNAILLRIGSWMIHAVNEGEIVAKGNFVKKALAWEILRNGYKEKLEIEWSDIKGIKATMEEGKPGTLELELSQKPKFYRNLHLDPRKHIQWVDGSDFTEGQALTCRYHTIMFKPGVLNEDFQRLVSSDQHLLELSQKPFSYDTLTFFPTEEQAAPTQNSGSQSHPNEFTMPSQQIQLYYHQSLSLAPLAVGNSMPPTPGVGFTLHPNGMFWFQNPLTMDVVNQLRSMTSHHQLQPRPTYVTANPPLAIYSEARPLMSSSRAAPPMRLPIVRGFNNQMLRPGHYGVEIRAIPMAPSSSSSALLAQHGSVPPNVSCHPWLSINQSIEHLNSRVMNMRTLHARMGISNDVLMNPPTYSHIAANGQSSNQPTGLSKVADGELLNVVANSNGVANGQFVNGVMNSNGASADDDSLNWRTNSNEDANGNQTHPHTELYS